MDILSKLLKLAPSGAKAELPPKIFFNMKGELTKFVKGEKPDSRFPIRSILPQISHHVNVLSTIHYM